MSGFPPPDAKKTKVIPGEAPEISTRQIFKEAASDTASLAAKYGFKTIQLGGGFIGLVGAPLILTGTLYKAGGHISEGRFAQASMDLLPVLTEFYEVGMAGLAAKQALQQGVWQAAKTGGARLITGTSLAVGVGGGLALTLAADLGQSALHNSGYNVDNGYLATMQNKAWNVNTAARALFPEDTPPVQQQLITNNTTTMTQTAPYKWDLRTEFEIGDDGLKSNVIVTDKVNMSGIGAFYEEFKYFSTFYGNYQFTAQEDGKPRNYKAMNEVAQAMYEHPEQAFDRFRAFLYDSTVDAALRIAAERKIKINGTGQQLNETDSIPADLMKEAATETFDHFRKAYKVAGTQYLSKGLAYLNPDYVKPENLNPALMEEFAFLEKFGRGFNWENPEHAAQLKASIDKALETNRPVTPASRPAIPAHRADPAVAEPLLPKPDAATLHAINGDIADCLITTRLMDKETNSFDHAKVKELQDLLVRGGYLSPTYHTGSMNGFTMRALDTAVKSEFNPSDMNEMRSALADKAVPVAASLKETPADFSAFDPRVLTFQTNAYLLGLYDGQLDGLNGPMTTAARNKFDQLQQTATVQATVIPSTKPNMDAPAPEMAPGTP